MAASIVRGQAVLTPEGSRPADIVIEGEAIQAVVEHGKGPAGAPVQDFGTLAILPGLVDTNVRVNAPMVPDWDGYPYVSRAAAAGGVTTIVDMPIHATGLTSTAAAVQEKISRAQGRLHVDCGFYGAVVPDGKAELNALLSSGILGMKCTLKHPGSPEFPMVTPQELATFAPVIGSADLPLLVHAEYETEPNPEILERHLESPKAYAGYLNSRPMRFEVDAVRHVIELARTTKARMHILHCSASGTLEPIEDAQAEGVSITAETCPHYLVLTSEGIFDGDTHCKVGPPIRGESNRNRLWGALEDGILGLIVTDHSTCPTQLRHKGEGDLAKAFPGIASIQVSLPVIWTEARRRAHSLEKVVEWMSAAPARFVGLGKKGAIAPGRDADLVVFDPDARFRVEQSMFIGRDRASPYEGQNLYGRVMHTYLRGQRIYDWRKDEGVEFPAGAIGKVLTR